MADRNEVARLAGVSGATVSRVYNRPETVSRKTRERVLEAASKLDYHPNVTAGNFVRGITGNVGVVMPYIPGVHIFSPHYFSELLSGIGEVVVQEGRGLMLFFYNPEEDSEEGFDKYFFDGRVDGCILLGTRRNDKALNRLYEKGRKFCLVNNYTDNKNISYVDADNVKGSWQAVKHLIGLGHRKIAFLNGPMDFINSLDRLKGYEKALKEHGIKVPGEYRMEGNYGFKSGRTAGLKILKMKIKPTAVFVSNDRMAAGLLSCLMEKGISVPGDISLVGYDDADIATLVQPVLTTVKVPFFDMGRICAGRFLEVLKGERDSFGTYVDTELAVRDSCRSIKPE